MTDLETGIDREQIEKTLVGEGILIANARIMAAEILAVGIERYSQIVDSYQAESPDFKQNLRAENPNFIQNLTKALQKLQNYQPR
ncbi:MAG: hypothetical protein AABX71_00175 [Nanoarchaeota archaeon]